MIYSMDSFEILQLNTSHQKDNLVIDRCIVNNLYLSALTFSKPVTINNSILGYFDAVGVNFTGGFILRNCIVCDSASFDSGGFNSIDSEFVIENNIFRGFVDFFHSQFDGPFIFKNNIVLAESNLLGLEDVYSKPVFTSSCNVEGNIGNLNANAVL